MWWNRQTRYFEVVVRRLVQVQVLSSAPTRIWWNWQTRMIQVHVLRGMQVQVLLSAPDGVWTRLRSDFFVCLFPLNTKSLFKTAEPGNRFGCFPLKIKIQNASDHPVIQLAFFRCLVTEIFFESFVRSNNGKAFPISVRKPLSHLGIKLSC